MPKSTVAKITTIAVVGLCLAISACGKKGDASSASADYSAFASDASDSDLGSSAPSEVSNAQLPGMAPAYSSAAAS